jgi:hypothetical protein
VYFVCKMRRYPPVHLHLPRDPPLSKSEPKLDSEAEMESDLEPKVNLPEIEDYDEKLDLDEIDPDLGPEVDLSELEDDNKGCLNKWIVKIILNHPLPH